MNRLLSTISVVCLLSLVNVGHGEDWPRFRGPNASGIRNDADIPITWGDNKNLTWKIPLPGPGSSSPIVVDGKVFVTCYSGYGVSGAGEQKDLKRHLVCVDAKTGKVTWERTVAAVLPEDTYRGFITHHGYASHTPASDGQRVYAFFGKTGVIAFDLTGEKLWQTSVGTGSGTRGWGTAASPIVYKNLVIVNASAESQAIYALDSKTGDVVWKVQPSGLASCWGTPVLADTEAGAKELVLAVPNAVWGMDPNTGKRLWTAKADVGQFVCPSAITHGNVVYACGGRGRGDGALVAIKTGGRGEVTNTHVLWTCEQNTPVPTPLFFEDRLYCFSDSGSLFCVDAITGKANYSERLLRGGGGGNRAVYASMIATKGKLIAVSRMHGAYVVAPGATYKNLAINRFAQDSSAFHGTPAISDHRMYLRSNEFLYCIQEETKSRR